MKGFMAGHRVTLEAYEMELAAMVGARRHIDALRYGRKERFIHPLPTDKHLAIDIDAAGAEIAVAKFLRRYWVAGFGAAPSADPDVAPDIEVRLSKKEDGPLLVRPGTRKDRPYVLVRGSMPNYVVVGWIMGADAMRDEYKANPNGGGECYLVPDDQLHAEFTRSRKTE